jgi:hypothetical protein
MSAWLARATSSVGGLLIGTAIPQACHRTGSPGKPGLPWPKEADNAAAGPPGVLSGGLVEFTLGLISGGGSIMATRLLLYVVELQPHVDIGTGAPNCGEVRFQERRGDLWSSAMVKVFGRRPCKR